MVLNEGLIKYRAETRDDQTCIENKERVIGIIDTPMTFSVGNQTQTKIFFWSVSLDLTTFFGD